MPTVAPPRADAAHGSARPDTLLIEPRVTVLHVGARLDYAAAAALAKAGMLERLYTDVVGNRGVVGSIETALPPPLRNKLPKPVRRLFARRVPDVIPTAALSFAPWRGAFDVALRLAGLGNYLRRRWPLEKALRRRLRNDGFGSANTLYTFLNSDAGLAVSAREVGLRVVHDQYVNPSIGRILAEERAQYPGLETEPSSEEIERGIEADRRKWAISDLILAPSDFVRDGIVALGGAPERVRVLPYGIDPAWLIRPASPVPGRVLFVGSVGLLKGNHYLAEAARLLGRRGLCCDVRVVGPVQRRIAEDPLFEGPTYVGQVPRGEVAAEFAQADVFVLPSLSDAFPIVHLEAMAHGVPVIATPNTGTTVRDGVEGFIVPIRDPNALGDRIEQVITDRALRDELSANARRRAETHGWERYGERLIGLLRELHGAQD